MLHSVQLVPHMAYRDAEQQEYLNLTPSQTAIRSIPVHAGITVELAIARYWSASGRTIADVNVEFRGVRPDPRELTLSCGGGGSGVVRLFSEIRNEAIAPAAKLTKWRSPLAPKAEGVVSPLGDRDVLPSESRRIYQLVLTYEFEQEEDGSFTPRAPALQGYLYESALESQMMLVFDADKKLLGTADSWPSEIKAQKGTVTIRLQIRHDDPELLEKLRDLEVWIERKLKSDITLSPYASHEAMIAGKGTMKKRVLRKGATAAVIFKGPERSKIPKGCKCGDVLMGTASYAAGSTELPGSGKRPGGFPVRYVVGPKLDSKNDDAATGKAPELPDERTVDLKIDEAVRDLKVGELGKLSGDEKKDADEFEGLFDKLREEYPDHIPTYIAAIKFFDSKGKRRDENLDKIVELADTIVGLISESELAVHFGTNYDKEDAKSCKVRRYAQIFPNLCFY